MGELTEGRPDALGVKSNSWGTQMRDGWGSGRAWHLVTRLVATLSLIAIVLVAAERNRSSSAAETPAPPAGGAPTWVYNPAATYAEGDIVARMGMEGIDRAESIRRFHVEDAVSGVLKPMVESRWPDTFAGVWIDVPPRSFGVTVAFTTGAQDNLAELRDSFPFPNDLHTVTAPMSMRDIRATLDGMSADRSALQRGERPAGLSDAIAATGGHYDLGTDVENNRILVSVSSDASPAVADAFSDEYGGNITVNKGLSQPLTCASQEDCRYAMMGGLRLTNLSNTGSNFFQICSAGFTGYYTTDSTKAYILSAGHCNDDPEYQNQPYQNGFASYGTVTQATKSGKVDAERVKRTYAPWRDSGKFLVLGESLPRPVQATKAHANMVVGDYLGKTGATTGTTRGYIRDLDYRPSYVPNSSSFLRVSMCVDHGDSGGSVWSSYTAWGIVSGGTEDENGNDAYAADGCRDINGNVIHSDSGNSGQTIIGAIDFALSNLGVTLYTGRNVPPVAAISASCSAPSCTFSSSGSKDEDGNLSSRSWTFGDGSPAATGTSVSHTYSTNGQYTVTVTVTDDDGATDSASTTVDFRVRPPTIDSATATSGLCGAVINFSAPSSGMAPKGYQLYRSTTSGGSYTYLQAVPNYQTSVTDTTAQPSKTYYYVMKSTYNSWASGYSNQRSVTTGVCVPR